MSDQHDSSPPSSSDSTEGEPSCGATETDGLTEILDEPESPLLGKKVRLALSAFLIFHVLAMALPPLAFQARGIFGPSTVVETLLRPVRGYGQFLYLDRGYAFFAPDPGPSHLIQARVTAPDGQVTETMFPDRNSQWPRLAYHRHFMVSEFLTEIYEAPGPPQELIEEAPDEARLWEQARARYEHFRQSIQNHLQNKHPGKTVEIRRIEHVIPSRPVFLESPIELTDPRLYNVMLDQPLYDELLEPSGPAEIIPPPAEATEDSPPDQTPSNESKPEDGSDTEIDGEKA